MNKYNTPQLGCTRVATTRPAVQQIISDTTQRFSSWKQQVHSLSSLYNIPLDNTKCTTQAIASLLSPRPPAGHQYPLLAVAVAVVNFDDKSATCS
jgi:hypothetical protein